MAKVVIFGTGEIAEVALFYLKEDSPHDVVAFTMNEAFITDSTWQGLPVVAFETLESEYPPSEYQLFIPISYKGVNTHRRDRFNEAKQRGYSCVSYISSRCTYYGTPVGENCFIFENNVIQPCTEIGDNCILWSGNHIGHHTRIKDHCFLASHVVVSGHVEIGEGTFIGVNATLRDNITIGQYNVIGAGSLILSDTEDKAVYTIGESTCIPKKSDELRGI